MIEFRKGNIFDSTARVFVNPTNFEGPMHGGLARQFADKFTGLEPWYCKQCKDGKVKDGVLAVFHAADGFSIINLPTMHLGEPADLKFVKQGLHGLCEILATRPAPFRMAVPKLGCGVGGLDWVDVKPLMTKALSYWTWYEIEIWE